MISAFLIIDQIYLIYIYFIIDKSYSFCNRIFYPISSRFIVKLNFAGSIFSLSILSPSFLFGASNLILHDKWQHIIEPNESSPSTVSLRSLQEILYNRIIQKKAEMHRTKNTGDMTDRVWTEIETLQWVLAQILMLLQRSSAGKK